MADRYPVPPGFAEKSPIPHAKYEAMITHAETDPDGFWDEIGKRIDWITPYSKISNVSWDPNDLFIKWYEDGSLNVSVNCIDRHLPHRADKTAILFEGDEPGHARHIPYSELYKETCRLANVLKQTGVRKGDRVIIYMPMIPQATYAMLACARIGAIHSVIFGGFSPEAIASRIEDCGASCVITADQGMRGGKIIPLKDNIDKALAKHTLNEDGAGKVLIWQHTGAAVEMTDGRDIVLNAIMAQADTTCPPEEMKAEDPLFILYTSGSTGKPKGVLHTSGGYITYASYTHEMIFDLREDDVYWCTADIGWITGHSYIVYGPLANGATSVMFEGGPNYPDCGRFWDVVDTHNVTIFYTAPTAIRALMAEGEDFVKRYKRTSLRLLGTVGEPINPEAWKWYQEIVGEGRCPIVDTWWQTETGGILISPIPSVTALKPGSATRPVPGIKAALLDKDGEVIEGPADGILVLTSSWPGQMRTVYGDHQRFIDTYFSTYRGLYFTGDGAKRDEDGYFWITGRVDDVLNVAGHRLGTAEIESALVAHKDVAEAAVIGYPHDIRGQGIYCFVVLNVGAAQTNSLERDLRDQVRQQIGPVATPDIIHCAPGLPKTRSGKIMRRILRKIGENDVENLGDVSTLAEPDIVATLIAERKTI